MTDETKPKRTYTRKVKTVAPPPEPEPEVPAEPEVWTPGASSFINLKGKMYLPARRRVQWMRGNPVPHPDWTIDTELLEHERGKRSSVSRVEGGYALVRANVYDDTGRLIATGLKSEYSENFADYLEKAETGAIARALAIAGYGTESALDLDEGVDGGRIADSPVAPSVTASAVPGVGRGGHTGGPNDAQIREVARLARVLGLAASSVVEVAAARAGTEAPELPDDPDLVGPFVRKYFESLTSEVVGQVISDLRALAETEPPEDD